MVTRRAESAVYARCLSGEYCMVVVPIRLVKNALEKLVHCCTFSSSAEGTDVGTCGSEYKMRYGVHEHFILYSTVLILRRYLRLTAYTNPNFVHSAVRREEGPARLVYGYRAMYFHYNTSAGECKNKLFSQRILTIARTRVKSKRTISI